VHLRNITMDPVAGARLVVAPTAWGLELEVERCITGAIRADLGARPIRVTDTVVDGVGTPLALCGPPTPAPPGTAVGPTGPHPPMLTATGATFAGAVAVDAVDATDCLFVDGLAVVQTQVGCIRFSYVADSPSAGLPVTHRCIRTPAPTFESTGFESPGYLALALDRNTALLGASSTGGAIGADAHARSGARIARLRRRIDEFVPMGLRPRLHVARGEAT
jgi:hypothetical protein